MSEVLFSSVEFQNFDGNTTLPAKFKRLLEASPIKDRLEKKRVAIKMHVGRGIGYTTISPLFVRILGAWVKEHGGKPFVTDQSVSEAKSRGYSEEVLGMPVLDVCGLLGKYIYPMEIDYKSFKNVDVAGYIHDADVLINFSHVKGHGSCGYGGACKNIAMGCVTDRTRGQIHGLEGGLKWDRDLCVHCDACVQSCNHNANRFKKDGTYDVDYHFCTYCHHCVKVCPTNAVTVDKNYSYEEFQTGMAICTENVLSHFDPADVFHINFLTDMTILCDCWGLSTPPLFPDVGIMASGDIVAVEKACLDQIKEENLDRRGLPAGFKLDEAGTHIFEKIHGKNPFIQLEKLSQYGMGTQEYTIKEIK